MCVCYTRVGLAGSLSPLPTPAPALASPSHRGKRCDAWSYALIPTTKPGQFTVENKGERGMSGEGTAALGTSHVCSSGSETEADREDIHVIETDYTNFALVLSLRQTSSLTIIRVNLLGEPPLAEAWSGWCCLGWGMAWGQMPHHHQVLRAVLCSSGHR